jgi:CBS domain-containing protein
VIAIRVEEEMLVNEIMKKPPATCAVNDTVTQAARIMHDHRCGFVPVVDSQGSVIGVITDRDVCLAVGDKKRAMAHVPVQDVMSHPAFSCFEDENLKVTLGTMARRHVRRLPVLDKHGHLQGIVSIDDVIQAPSKRGSPSAEEMLAALKGITVAKPIEVAST